MDAKQVVTTTIRELLFLGDEEEINPESTLSDLGADSLDLVEIIIEVEDTFGLDETPEDDIDLGMTVQQLMDYVEDRVKKAA